MSTLCPPAPPAGLWSPPGGSFTGETAVCPAPRWVSTLGDVASLLMGVCGDDVRPVDSGLVCDDRVGMSG